ncbi:MAG: 5'/3'-nucleotidase SurE [Rhodobacteraceae bacterium]|nr:5'/3'-nucleotidase SurE [Paracoccaceae bacterium]
MRILITNDDGIDAPGLEILSAIGEALAGQGGEVWTIAPATEQSGVGHSVSFVRPFLINEISARRFSVEGTPADCVLAGIHDVMAPSAPDLVLSGINRGNNAGENALYSGTVGAAMEASLHGITGIALSQFYGPGNRTLANPFEAAEQFAAKTISTIIDRFPEAEGDYPPFFNVNFPPCGAADVVGTRIVSQGFRHQGRFRTRKVDSITHRNFLWIQSGDQSSYASPGTDVAANLDRYISLTPMRADLTAYDTMKKLQGQVP